MNKAEMNKAEALKCLRDHVETLGSQRRAAAELGISEQYLSDVINERRDPWSVLARLGMVRIIRYRWADNEQG